MAASYLSFGSFFLDFGRTSPPQTEMGTAVVSDCVLSQEPRGMSVIILGTMYSIF